MTADIVGSDNLPAPQRPAALRGFPASTELTSMWKVASTLEWHAEIQNKCRLKNELDAMLDARGFPIAWELAAELYGFDEHGYGRWAEADEVRLALESLGHARELGHVATSLWNGWQRSVCDLIEAAQLLSGATTP
jgi:hypothetical protein